MKNKNIILSILGVLIIILLGIGIGFFIFKDNKELNVELKQVDAYTQSVLINDKAVVEGYEIQYEVVDDLVVIKDSGTSDIEKLYIYNYKGEQLFEAKGVLANGLLLTNVMIDKDNKKITLNGSLTEETGGISQNVHNMTGKGLYELTCSELEYYKDKLVASETFELKITGDKISELTSIEKIYFENTYDYSVIQYECKKENPNYYSLEWISSTTSKNGITVEIDYIEELHDSLSVKINNKEVGDEINNLHVSSLEYFSDVVIIVSSDTSGGTSNLYIYDKNGNQLFAWDKQNKDLFFEDYTIQDNVIRIKTHFISEEAEYPNVSGKSVLYEMTCSELEYYKDKIIAEKTYEISYNNSKLSDMKTIETLYLKDSTVYDYTKNTCKNVENS